MIQNMGKTLKESILNMERINKKFLHINCTLSPFFTDFSWSARYKSKIVRKMSKKSQL